MADSPRSLSLARRLKARLGRELAIWGLREPAALEGSEGCYSIEATSSRDRWVVEGFLAARVGMVRFDLQRRLWAGRIAELLGDRLWVPGVTASDLDVFIRILGFREEAEQQFRRLEPAHRELLEAYAQGVNAWIDAGSWKKQEIWRSLGSRPRLWGGSDSLLLSQAPARVDAALRGPVRLTAAPGSGLDSPEQLQRVQKLWEALRDDGLRAPGSWGAGARIELEHSGGRSNVRLGVPSELPVRGLERTEPPQLVPVEVLGGEDNHRFDRGEGRWGRLAVERADVAVRGSAPRRHWIRRTPRGGLVSDLLLGGERPLAPAGTALQWCWGSSSEQPDPGEPERRPLSPDHPWCPPLLPTESNLSRTRLVPLEGGA